jgi:hypothetical protein
MGTVRKMGFKPPYNLLPLLHLYISSFLPIIL